MSDVTKAWTKEELESELLEIIVAIERKDELIEAIKAQRENRLVDMDDNRGWVVKKTIYGKILGESP